MNSKCQKITISEKLLRNTRRKIKKEDIAVQDIEDTVAEGNSKYFSPMATRFQRKVLNRPIQELTNKKVKKNVKFEENDDMGIKEIKDEKQDEKPKLVSKIEIVKASTEGECKNLVDAIWEPKDWEKMFENIRSMRALIEAPVDTMGCHKCQDVEADRKTQRYQILVSLMLSSQTKDEVTHAAVERLLAHNLTPKVISQMDAGVLEKIIHPVGFYKTKAKHLKLTSQILVDKYDSDIPRTTDELIKLPGVGPKMAHLCMSEAWDEITGIGVDVHVHRISNRLKWVPQTTKNPEQTRVALESWLPRTMWREINHSLVGFGQTVCLPVRPKCTFCLNNNICPSALKDNEKPKTSKTKK